MILEDEWLKKHQALIDYESKACVLHKGNKKITIQSVITNKKVFTQDKILSVLQFNRAVKKVCQPLVVQLKKVTNHGTSGDPPMERRKVTNGGSSRDFSMERRKIRDDGPSRDPSMEELLKTTSIKELLEDPSTTLTSNFRFKDSLIGPLVKESDDIF